MASCLDYLLSFIPLPEQIIPGSPTNDPECLFHAPGPMGYRFCLPYTGSP